MREPSKSDKSITLNFDKASFSWGSKFLPMLHYFYYKEYLYLLAIFSILVLSIGIILICIPQLGLKEFILPYVPSPIQIISKSSEAGVYMDSNPVNNSIIEAKAISDEIDNKLSNQGNGFWFQLTIAAIATFLIETTINSKGRSKFIPKVLLAPNLNKWASKNYSHLRITEQESLQLIYVDNSNFSIVEVFYLGKKENYPDVQKFGTIIKKINELNYSITLIWENKKFILIESLSQDEIFFNSRDSDSSFSPIIKPTPLLLPQNFSLKERFLAEKINTTRHPYLK